MDTRLEPLKQKFRKVIALDAEFIESAPGAFPWRVVCFCWKDLLSGEEGRAWHTEFTSEPPFPIDETAVIVSYNATAEIMAMRSVGWPDPVHVLDLYVEHLNSINGLDRDLLGISGKDQSERRKAGLLDAMAARGLSGISREEKSDTIALILSGGPWSPEDRQQILDYCASDVVALERLLPSMIGEIEGRRKGVIGALGRGRYMRAVSTQLINGVPIDVDSYHLLQERREEIQLELIRRYDSIGVCDHLTFKEDRFRDYLMANRLAWPGADQGSPKLDSGTFKDMCRRYPELEPIRQLRKTLGAFRRDSLAIGPDGRNHPKLWPFKTFTGRNAPSPSEAIFQRPKWQRFLIKPAEGRAFITADWSAQEVWCGAHLSRDRGLLDALGGGGDIYLKVAELAGAVPAGAIKDSHPVERGLWKVALLGTNYGSSAQGLAGRTGESLTEAIDVQRRLAQLFPQHHAWAEDQLVNPPRGRISTPNGWQCDSRFLRPNVAMNWPVQALGSEICRLACIVASERGMKLCISVHDSLGIECAAEDVEETLARLSDAMSIASRVILDGIEIPSEAAVAAYPDRYYEKDGAEMWRTVSEILGIAT